jgi:bifunctional non-homologous end joining protein LigD
LEQIMAPVSEMQVGGYVENHGKALLQLAKEKGLVGIIAKRKSSIYRPGKRSPDWLKIKSRPQQEFVVGGFPEGKNSRSKHFGALLLGASRDGKLHYYGHSGSGFSKKGLKEALDRLKPLFIDKSPFVNPPKIPERIQWVKPELVCEVAFAEWTSDGQMRQTTFLGLRPDKNPREVVLELARERYSHSREIADATPKLKTCAVSLHFELLGCIDPNFRLSFVHLDPTGDFDMLAFDARQHGRFRNW